MSDLIERGPNLGVETDEPGLRSIIMKYYMPHFPAHKAAELTGQYISAIAAASEEARRAERAAVVRECAKKAEVYRDSATGGMAAIADTIACSIREFATDADNAALDKLLREARMEGMERAALAVTERADQEDEFATIHEKRGNGYKAGKAARVVTTLRGVAAHIRILAALEAPQ